jgi:F420-dependent oxidoreductase-like protein
MSAFAGWARSFGCGLRMTKQASRTIEEGAVYVGVCVPNGVLGEFRGWDAQRAWARSLEVARQAEALGFESIWIPDHMQNIRQRDDAPTFEAFVHMSALAGATSRVRLVPGVLSAGFRNPALLAKMVATLYVASGGRMEVGIGAGWNEWEWRGYGYGFPSARERLRMLEDALEIVRRMLAPGPATWAGAYWQVDEALCAPKGVQPHIPIVVGGNGQQVTWRLAARYADELNLDGPSLAQVRDWLPIVRQRCEEIGRDPATLRVSAQIWWDGAGPERVERLATISALGLARIHSDIASAVDSDEPLHSFAEDCRAAGIEMAA